MNGKKEAVFMFTVLSFIGGILNLIFFVLNPIWYYLVIGIFSITIGIRILLD